MGADHVGDDDQSALAERLGTDNVSFVDALNTEIAATIEDTDHLQFDYLAGDVSDYGVSSNGHAHFDLVHNDSSIHCVCFISSTTTRASTVSAFSIASHNSTKISRTGCRSQ